MNFIVAVAYHFCLSLPVTFTQPGRSLLAEPCKNNKEIGRLKDLIHLPQRLVQRGGAGAEAVRGDHDDHPRHRQLQLQLPHPDQVQVQGQG